MKELNTDNMEMIVLPHYKGIKLPKVTDLDNAGVDLRAAQADTVVLQPNEDYTFPTGLKFHIGSHPLHLGDIGMYGCILPRSGLGFKHYTRLANTAGVIDANYLGEVFIKLRNEGNTPLEVKRGDRICQMVFHLYVKGVNFTQVDQFSEETSRGEAGFGDSGVK